MRSAHKSVLPDAPHDPGDADAAVQPLMVVAPLENAQQHPATHAPVFVAVLQDAALPIQGEISFGVGRLPGGQPLLVVEHVLQQPR